MHITEQHRRTFRVLLDRWVEDIDRLDIRRRPDPAAPDTPVATSRPAHPKDPAPPPTPPGGTG